MLNSEEIKDFFLLESSHAKKELGQNFLIDENIASQIVDELNFKTNEEILEIGPGLGSLTEKLVDRNANLTVVEIDNKFINYLSLAFKDKIIIKKCNILNYEDCHFKKVIGNLPYYITSEILEKIALDFNNLEEAVFMVQLEALDRILSNKGKNYSPLNILLAYKYKIIKLFKVSKTSFFPMPNVASSVFKLVKKDNIDNVFTSKLYKVATICFANRRKTLSNNLKSLIKDENIIKKVFVSLNLKPTIRAEELSIKDYEILTKELLNLEIIDL